MLRRVTKRNNALTDTQTQTFHDELSYDGNQMKETFKIMQQMRKDKILCDVTLSVGNVEIPAHKTVLAASSRYFYVMLVLSNNSKQNRITISDITPDALVVLINYIYTGEVQITEINVKSLLQAAHILMLAGVKEMCCKILKTHLTSNNCLGTGTIAEKYECLELFKDTLSYANEHFSEIVKCKQFCSLTYERLSKLISRDILVAPKEETIYEALITWVNHDLKQRRKYLVVLMQHVRFSSIPTTYIAEHVANEPLIKENIKCKDFIIEAFQHHHSQKGTNSKNERNENRSLILPINKTQFNQSASSNEVFRTLLDDHYNKSRTALVAIGGESEKASKTLEYYDFQTQRWFQVSQMPLRDSVNAMNIKSKLYLMDQNHSTSLSSNMYQLNVLSNYNKVTFTNCVIPAEVDKSFLVGGTLNDIKQFDLQTKTWLPIPPMMSKRRKYGAGVVNSTLYVIGGLDEKSAERYDGYSWQMLPPMQNIRYDMGIGVIDSTLYAIGGHDGSNVLKSVEAFDTKTNSWKQLPPMNQARQRPGVAIANNLVYVVGGWDGTNSVRSAEIYSPLYNGWEMLPTVMNVARSNPFVGVVCKPTSIDKLAYD